MPAFTAHQTGQVGREREREREKSAPGRWLTIFLDDGRRMGAETGIDEINGARRSATTWDKKMKEERQTERPRGDPQHA